MGTFRRLLIRVSVDTRTGEQYFCGNNRYVISKVTTLGSVSVFAGTSVNSGRNDGTEAAAKFSYDVYQISYCKYDGNFYIVDTNSNIRPPSDDDNGRGQNDNRKN